MPPLSPATPRRRARAAGLGVPAVLGLLLALITWSAPRASAAATVYEAESASLSGGAVVASDHSGYTGSGFVAGYTDADKGSAATTFSVQAPAAGAYSVALRYANGTGATMTLSLYVGGSKVKQVSLPATADWNTWATETETVTLAAGANSLAYRFDSTDTGNVNLDDISLTAATRYEAESASLSGGAVVASDHSGYTGSGFVAGYTDADKGSAATTFDVQAPAAGAYSVALRYANGTGATMTLSLYVGGSKVKQVSLPATADWNTWATETETVTLAAGANSLAYRFDSTDTGNVNLDDISLTAATRYEAESASLSGGAVVASDHSGYTGSGFVAGYTDADKGSAATTFSVQAPTAGEYSVALRYANGTGATMTLSLYVGGSKVKQVSLPATADWNTWATETETVTLAAGANSLAYRFDSTDTGNVNLDSITLDTTGGAGGSPSPSPSASSTSTPPPNGQLYEAETAFTTGGPTLATSLSGYTGSGYLTGFSSGARATVTVAAPTAGSYPLTLRYANTTGAPRTLSLYLDGIRNQQLSLPTGSGWLTVTQNVPLRSGINLVGLHADSADNGSGVALDDLTVTGGSALAATGATLPYTEYPAASAQTNGTVLAPSRSYPSLQAEATARQPVQLTATGQYLQITLTKPANALVVRYSIPGNPDGSTATAPLALYANGTKLQDLTLTSQYSWLYGGGYYDTRNPSSGPAHHFYDEVRALIGDWPAGTVLKLQKDAADTAASYTLDVLDTEQVDPAPTMPAGFVSVTNYGVTPDSSADATNAVNTALAALSGTGTGLWFPPGTYLISGRINLASVAVRGAGPWRTVLKSTAENGSGGLYSTGGVVQIADLNILGDQTSRNNDSGAAGIEGSFAAGSLISDVWIEHTKVGIWAVPGTGLHISGVRVRDVFADGIHVHGGSTGVRVDQCEVRNTGDDEIALDSEGGTVTGSDVAYNTVSSPIQANGIGVYSGGDNTVRSNRVSDTVAFGSGITVSNAYGPGFSGPTTVSGNLLTRAGSWNSNWGSALGALWVYAVNYDLTQPVHLDGNTANDSSYQGLLLSYGRQISNLELSGDTFAGAGTWGIDIENVTGSMTATAVTVSGAASGGLNNPGNYTINRGAGDLGF